MNNKNNNWDFLCKSCEELDSRFALKKSDSLMKELEESNSFKKNLKLSKNASIVDEEKSKIIDADKPNSTNHHDEDEKKLSERNHDHHNHHDEHEEHDHDHGKEPWWKLIVGWILFTPFLITLFFSTIGGLTGPFLDFIDNPIFQFVDATILMLLIGTIFWKETIVDALQKQLSVDVLVAVSATLAYIFSTISFILILSTSKEPMLFFESVASILVIIYSGRFLESYIKNRAMVEIDELIDLIPQKATIVLEDDSLKEVEASSLKAEDIVLVRKGEQIPSDGIIIEGSSIIQEANFTGEANSLEKMTDDKVIGSTISMTGTIKIKITKALDDSIVTEIVQGIKETSSYRPETQKVADKIASYLIPIVIVAAVIAFLAWGTIYSLNSSLSKDWYDAFSILIAVMVIACPCSLGLATPSSILVGTSVAAKLGIYFNSKEVFESFQDVNKIILDKTGTITTGEVKFISTDLSDEYLELIYHAEKEFAHPLAKSIVVEFKDKFDKVKPTSLEMKEEQSLGISIKTNDKEYFFGSQKFLNEIIGEYIIPSEVEQQQNNGNIVLFMFDNNQVIGHIVFGDQIKETSIQAIENFVKKGIEVYMITGDNAKTANYIASQVGIKKENTFSEVLPNEKANLVKKLKEEDSKFVLFVGDGNNDALAMAEANLSISMNSGTDLAIQMSDVTILENDLNKINDVMYITDRTLRNIYRGLYVSIGYNFVSVPIAMTSLITPFIAAFVMMISDTIAIFNALTLRTILWKKEYRKNKTKK